ncbi:MAG: hypothetical protein U9Q16_02870 [Patescibacteria group bacterium]|nr:hypothetical protein [Patescibacteria group bacterium]
MAIQFVQQKKKQIYLIIILVGVVLATALVLWQGHRLQDLSNMILRSSSDNLDLPQHPEITIDFDVLEREDVKELTPFEEISPFDGETGRENPFLRKED